VRDERLPLMKANSSLLLRGRSNITLIPYCKEHVAIYNQWMKKEELLETTASEPLTLQEEYEMQASWRLDDKKCTFIILVQCKQEGDDLVKSLHQTETFKDEGRMIGDCNYYFNVDEEPHTAEIEIMIAEECARRRGYAQEALSMFIIYGIKQLGITKLVAKISLSNFKSLALFQEKFGFLQVSRSDVFQEVTLELDCSDAANEWKNAQEDSFYAKIHLDT
jgi:RimJ/RimL family protein N-acetyltransferase